MASGSVISGSGLRLGSGEHKELFCRVFLDTHVSYDVDAVEWPDLTDEDHRTLSGLPIWDDAVNTERETAILVRATADHEDDPLMARAIAVQALEEERHAVLVTRLVERYRIDVPVRPIPVVTHPDWAFMKSGWGESLDAFFAFGIFAVARDAEIVPPELIHIFDTVMQEEARHILFFENWRLYRRHAGAATAPAVLPAQAVAAAALVIVDRLRLALSSKSAPAGDQNFMLSGAKALGELTVRGFADTCLAENERRFAPYDDRLPRPRAVPALVRAIRPLLPTKRLLSGKPAGSATVPLDGHPAPAPSGATAGTPEHADAGARAGAAAFGTEATSGAPVPR